MLIMARLLSPSDFGLIAIAMTIILILEAALELPLSQALVSMPEIKDSYYDTAFTLGILRGAILCTLVFIISLPFAAFYHQKELVPLIQLLSLAPAARGLLNPRMAKFAKDLNFKYEFIFELIGKILAFILGTTTALITHSYWSIALCTITAPIIISMQSYFIMPFKPKLSLGDWRIFSGFLGWISLSQLVLAINWQSDQLLLGKLMPPAKLGLFSTANNITNIPMAALFSPLLRPLLSAFTVLKDNPLRLRNSYLNSASAIVAIGLPLLVGQSSIAAPTIRLLLGDKWLGAIPMVHWLSLSLIPLLFGMLLTPLSMALGETREMVWRNVFQMLVKLPFVIIGALMYGFTGVIAARLISETLTSIYCMIIIRRLLNIKVIDQLISCSRSIISTIAMAGALAMSSPYLCWQGGPAIQFLDLLANIAVGIIIYCGCLFSLWSLAGRPTGIEGIALAAFFKLIKKFYKLNMVA
jgi:O-antigen/teichoic acid export membrane protein